MYYMSYNVRNNLFLMQIKEEKSLLKMTLNYYQCRVGMVECLWVTDI